MVFRRWHRDKNKRKNLLRYFVTSETNSKYKEWIEFLKRKWWKVVWIVCDWRQWLLWWFWDIATQFCIYHFKQIITRYLTKKPKLEPNKELKAIADDIGIRSYKSMTWLLETRYNEHKEWLSEKNESWNHIHERTRKAYRSMKRNMYRAYTFERHPELQLPKTNNSLEATNGHMKSKLRIHRGLTKERKQKFIVYYLYIS
jgi:hypothetical protein